MDLSIEEKISAWIKPNHMDWVTQADPETDDERVLLSADSVTRPLIVISFLTVFAVVSALSVIYAAFEYRRLFNNQQQLLQQWDDIQVEWGQLLLEQSALGANSRVERLATTQLKMSAPSPEQVEIVQYER